MNSERFYSQNNTTNIIQDFIKKGSLTCNLSCLWKVSCCHFSGVAPLPTDNDFLVLWFFLAAFLQHCWSSTKRTGAGAGSGQTTALCLGADWHCFPSRTVVNLRKHVTCTIIMTCNVGYLWDTYGILCVLLWHSKIAMGRCRWMRITFFAPPGTQEFHRLGWPVDGSGHLDKENDSPHDTTRGYETWRWSCCEGIQLHSLWLSHSLSLSMYNIVQLQSIIYSII